MTMKKYSGKYTLSTKILLAAQFAWMSFGIMSILAYYIIYSQSVAAWVIWAMFLTEELASLLTVAFNCQFLFKIEQPRPFVKALVVCVMASINLITQGWAYIWFFHASDPNGAIAHLLFSWYNLGSYWYVAMFVFDIMPILFLAKVCSKLTSQMLIQSATKDKGKMIKVLYSIDKSFFLLLFVHILNIAVFFIASHIQVYSLFVANDRTSIALLAIPTFCLAIHSTLCHLMILRIQPILKGIWKVTSKSGTSSNDIKLGALSKSRGQSAMHLSRTGEAPRIFSQLGESEQSNINW